MIPSTIRNFPINTSWTSSLELLRQQHQLLSVQSYFLLNSTNIEIKRISNVFISSALHPSVRLCLRH